MITADFHLHSSHSEDSETEMEKQIEAGIEAGLKIMCFTEHMDKDWSENADGRIMFEVDTESYYRHYLECRDRYRDRIDLRFGIEYGFRPHLTEHNREYINSYPFDFVIGSQHLMDGMDVYYPESFENKSEQEVYRRYFECTLESICLFDEYDVFGHLDYVVRYGPNKNKYYRYGDHEEVLEEILRQLIKRGKGIEINTSGFKHLGNEPNPCREILKRYHELGGELITIGSDAHEPGYVAYDFERARQLLLDTGYSHYCVFKDRRPEFVLL